MKYWISILLSFMMVSCFSQAQNKTSVPLLGSTQDITKSEFCKQYKCQSMPRENGLGYLLALPSDLSWDEIMQFESSKGKTQPQLWSEFRTIMFSKYDTKKQLINIEFQLQDEFRNNRVIQSDQSKMLADAMRYAVGKILPLDTSLGEKYSPDISECFAQARAFPKENFEPLTRILMTGEITLQVDKRKLKYRAVCSRRFNGSTKEEYRPAFWIEIPDLLK
jgi:hypothetical protein